MTRNTQIIGVPSILTAKPLQAAKFFGILLGLILGIGGFFRLINTGAIIDGPLVGDGQLLALIFIPLTSLGLVGVVVVETALTAYRGLRAEAPIREQFSGRPGYILLRVVEAGVAIVGVSLMVAALPVLFAASTPGPAGVGIMLLLMVVGLGILFASFVRAGAELFVYRTT